jgi:hypothetical protein
MSIPMFVFENLLAIKLFLTVVSAGVIFKIMLYSQKLKEEEADRKYKAFMKSKGLKTEVEDERND